MRTTEEILSEYDALSERYAAVSALYDRANQGGPDSDELYAEADATGDDLNTQARELLDALVASIREEHGDDEPGDRPTYDGKTGQFVAYCKCGREFRSIYDFGTALFYLSNHVEEVTDGGTSTERHDHG
jgi:hypothetical protein